MFQEKPKEEMCAGFKKSPISPLRYKQGFNLFSKLFLTPALKMTSAVVKDVNRMSKERSGSSSSRSLAMTSEHRISALNIRERGLQQCSVANELFAMSISQPLLPLDSAAIQKIDTASSRYLSKSSYCNVDFYAFAEDCIKMQIETVKREQTRLEYQRAQELLQCLMNGDKASNIIECLLEKKDAAQDDSRIF